MALPQNFHQSLQCLPEQHSTTVRKQAFVTATLRIYTLGFLSLTSAWTESIFLVIVKVVCGGTPAVAIVSALRGTLVILIPQKDEGEDTFISIGISSKCVQNCQDENWMSN